MGSQGNYPGSGAINQHKHLAMTGDAPGGSRNMDPRLQEGGEYGTVGGANMESVTENARPSRRSGDVRDSNHSGG